MISYNIVKNKIKFKCTWVHKNDQNVLYALSSNYLSDKRRGKIRRGWVYFQARLAFTMAAFNVLIQWQSLEPYASWLRAPLDR